MVKKTINELDNIGTNQEPSAVVAIEQNGATFKASVRPNPPEQLNVTSQAQLETAFGIDIEIPDNTTVVIVLDEGFNLSKPIKFGDGCNVEIYGSTPNTILNIIGAFGAVFQNTNPSDVAQELNFHNFKVIGSTGNILFDLKVTAVVKMRDMEIIDIDDLGILEAGAIGFDTLFFVDVIKGLIIKNPQIVRLSTTAIQNFSSPVFTFLSFILENPGTIILDGITAFGFSTGDELLFLDPNAPAGSNFIIEKSSVDGGDLYQQGNTVEISVVADNGSGKIRCTAVAHGLKDGQIAVLSGFGTETTYNGTFQITVIDANTFDVEAVTFVATDNGAVDGTSLDSTDVSVLAQNNPMQADSMFTGDAGLEIAAPITIPITTIGVAVPITDVNWSYNNLERFEEDTVVPNEGRLITKDTSTRRYLITYSATINRSGGGGTNYGIVLLKDGSIVGFNPPRVFTTSITPLTRTEVIELAEDEVIQVAVINYLNTNDIDLYQANVTVNRA